MYYVYLIFTLDRSLRRVFSGLHRWRKGDDDVRPLNENATALNDFVLSIDSLINVRAYSRKSGGQR